MNCKRRTEHITSISIMFSVIMASIRSLLKTLFDQFIHKDFHEAVSKMTLIDAFLFLVITKTLPYNA